MFRRSTNNSWIPVGGLNFGYVDAIGGSDPSPGAGQRFNGQLGQTVVHSNKTALQDSAKIGGVTLTLFEGVYQLVKFSTGVLGTTGFAGTVKRGSIVFWDTLLLNGVNTFTVTDIPTATGCFRAGIVVCPDTPIAGVAGKFGYIQVAGLSTCLYGAATSTTLGDLVFQGNSATTPVLTTNVVASLTDTVVNGLGASLGLVVKGELGLAYEVGAIGALRRVLMNLRGFHPVTG